MPANRTTRVPSSRGNPGTVSDLQERAARRRPSSLRRRRDRAIESLGKEKARLRLLRRRFPQTGAIAREGPSSQIPEIGSGRPGVPWIALAVWLSGSACFFPEDRVLAAQRNISEAGFKEGGSVVQRFWQIKKKFLPDNAQADLSQQLS
jgi:hypothetical protein